ncbi:hypothetical protein NP233_g5950 [Leucocoprinus birnbaumii]|uniref:Uncharacterized protein n=1 Tax=Leucocoprinus birnbaumii TaxID=56174 RepID=A0AAD5YRE6_9AGAR|nr:hypothetical protein NP233_g5950 [Leucocoprinus birnbaumii]
MGHPRLGNYHPPNSLRGTVDYAHHLRVGAKPFWVNELASFTQLVDVVMEDYKVNYHALPNVSHYSPDSGESNSIIARNDTPWVPSYDATFYRINADAHEPFRTAVETRGYTDTKNDGAVCWADSPRYNPGQRASSYTTEVFAPIPTPGYAQFLGADSELGYPDDYVISESRSTLHRLPTPHPVDYRPFPGFQQHDYAAVPSPHLPSVPLSRSTFPTPSELLVELSSQGLGSSSGSHQRPVYPQDHHPSVPLMGYPRPQRPSFCHAPPAAPVADSATLTPSASLGERTTETITSHEKKRHYLECLEHYVLFLHQHFEANGLQPAPIERISSYRCLSSRSIRSLLIHMEKTAQQMRETVYRAEQRFIHLREAVQQVENDAELAHAGKDN